MLRMFVILSLVLPVAAPAAASAERRHIEVSDFTSLTSLADPQLSPDGKSIAVVMHRANLKVDRFDSQLLLVNVTTRRQEQIATDQIGVSFPRWSPSGDRLGFLALAGQGNNLHPEIYVLTKATGKSTKITKTARGVEQFTWSPDGKRIVYVTSDEPPNQKDIAEHRDAFKVGDNVYLATEGATPSHIWLIAAGGGTARRLTSGSWSVHKNQGAPTPSSPLSWSPDGRYVVFGKQPNPSSGDEDRSELEVLDVKTGATRKLTQHTSGESLGTVSPDGSRVSYSFPHDPKYFGVGGTDIYVTAFQGGDGRDVTRSLDRDTMRGVWMPDGQALLLEGNDGTRSSLWLQPLDSAARRLDLGAVDPSSSFWTGLSIGRRGDIAFVGTTPDDGAELYYLASVSAAPRRLTDFNGERLAGIALGKSEPIDWQGPDGFHEDGILVYPPDFTKDRKYPLVLVIHGGPTGASVQSFDFLLQMFAAHGYLAFSPNYRGSDNLGNAYQRAVDNNAGDGPGRDVMSGVAAVVKRGFVDESRMAVTGYSYGGYMTAWLIGHYQGWKCAVAVAAVTNLVDWYDLSDINVHIRYLQGGRSPWVGNALQSYLAQSPITYMANARTPTLILADIGDPRVPVVQSYELYHALKDNGVPVEFWLYPTGGHFPTDPVRMMDSFNKWLGWVDRYFR